MINKHQSKTSKQRDPRSFLLKIHRYIALTVGFIFVILGLTGSANVFNTELEEFGLPSVSQEVYKIRYSLDQIMNTIRATHPQHDGSWSMVMPGYGRNYIWVIYGTPEETLDEYYAPLRVLVNPYTGNIVAEHFWGQTIPSLIYEVHADLLLGKLGAEIGEIGFNVVSFMGIFLFIMVLTGLYIWWPKKGQIKKAFTIKRNASSQRFYFDLHKMAGVYSSIILLVIAFSGFWFAYSNYIKPVVSFFSEVKY